jgi:multicopper oxidase
MTAAKISRRRFLGRSGQAGLAGLALVLGGRRLLVGPSDAAQATRGVAREFRLEAREQEWELAPGKVVKAMAYSGRIPGPEIRVKEGDRIRVTLKNGLPEPTTIHWHGLDVPNSMDGVPGVTQEPVPPGETFVYEFEARPAGTRWYHTHAMQHEQLDRGLYAPLIVEPAGPDPYPFDRQHTLVLDDWATGTGPGVADTRAGTAGGRGGMGGMMGGMMRGMMGGRGMSGMMRRETQRTYDVMTINGKAYPATEPLRVKSGERVRLRIINASAEHTHVVRLAGHRLLVTHTDGNPLVAPVEVDALPIAPAERYDVTVVADHPGAWFLYCMEPGHLDAGERMVVLYEGQERTTVPAPERELGGLALWDYGRGRGRDVLPMPATSDVRTFAVTLGGGMMGSDVWTINGKRYPDTDPLPCRKGDRVRVVLRNHSMEAHPMHLHGQSFRLLAANETRYAEPLVKDVVDVEPHMGSAVLEFTAHNPGDWFFHCHKPMHMMGGMIALVKIA